MPIGSSWGGGQALGADTAILVAGWTCCHPTALPKHCEWRSPQLPPRPDTHILYVWLSIPISSCNTHCCPRPWDVTRHPAGHCSGAAAVTPLSFSRWPRGGPSCRCPAQRCWHRAVPAAGLRFQLGNGRSPGVSSPIHPWHPQTQGCSGHPSVGTAGSALAPVMVGSVWLTHTPLPPVSPTTKVWGGACSRSSAPWLSSRLYLLPLGQAKPDTRSPPPLAPPGISPLSFPSFLITPGSFLPGNPRTLSLAVPLPHQLPSTVLPGGSTNHLVPSLRDCSPRPYCGHMAGSTLPKPLSSGPAALPKSALAAGPMRLNGR